MCYHKLFIFTTCGHSFFQAEPLVQCKSASIGPHDVYSSTCRAQSHPYQTRNVDSLCSVCTRRRDVLLGVAAGLSGEVRFEEWRWRMKYQSPAAEQSAWKQQWDNSGQRASRGRIGRLKAGLRISGGGGGVGGGGP